MIELRATGPVQFRVSNDFDYEDGHDRIVGNAEFDRTSDAVVEVEFTNGHVNLEAFVPSNIGEPVLTCLEQFVSDLPFSENTTEWFLLEEQWDVVLYGEWRDWIQQADRWISERPDRSLVSALERFKRWDETKTTTLETAIVKLDYVDGAETPIGELTTGEYAGMCVQLNELGVSVDIPNPADLNARFFADEQTDD